MWYINAMFYYMFKAEFVNVIFKHIYLKVPSFRNLEKSKGKSGAEGRKGVSSS